MAASTRTFQSTHPLRGATSDRTLNLSKAAISIHAPLAGCDAGRCTPKSQKTHFNPRTPCGVRLRQRLPGRSAARFQSTHPLRGATPADLVERGLAVISIHAPLAGCDLSAARPALAESKFQSTHPLRGATAIASGRSCSLRAFQSTHPLRGATSRTSFRLHAYADFNPRTPCGVRQDAETDGAATNAFQSTRPLRGATTPRIVQQ